MNQLFYNWGCNNSKSSSSAYVVGFSCCLPRSGHDIIIFLYILLDYTPKVVYQLIILCGSVEYHAHCAHSRTHPFSLIFITWRPYCAESWRRNSRVKCSPFFHIIFPVAKWARPQKWGRHHLATVRSSLEYPLVVDFLARPIPYNALIQTVEKTITSRDQRNYIFLGGDPHERYLIVAVKTNSLSLILFWSRAVTHNSSSPKLAILPAFDLDRKKLTVNFICLFCLNHVSDQFSFWILFSYTF